MMATLFVDDILMTSSSISLLQQVQDTLKTKFSISALGPVSLILGMEVIRDEARGNLKLSQQKSVNSILGKFGIDSSNLSYTQDSKPASKDTLLKLSEKTKLLSYVWEPYLPGPEHKIRHSI
ncbi:unnamed protein product [Sphacelaria rigidula]